MPVNFEFNAPQFVNISEDPDADRFFDESVEANENKAAISSSCNAKITLFEDHEIENKDPAFILKATKVPRDEEVPILRKVLNEINEKNHKTEGQKQKQEIISKDEENQLLQDFETFCINKKLCKPEVPSKPVEVFEGIPVKKSDVKRPSITTRLDSKTRTPVINGRIRSLQQNEKVDSEVKPNTPSDKNTSVALNLRRSNAVKRKGSPLVSEKKFISLAERVNRFHSETPDRFRTIPKNKITRLNVKPRQTLPKTPILSAKNRRRPVNFPDAKQREELELDEMKKYQVKAHPLNVRILKEPSLTLKYPVEKKPTTVPEPFRLTEVKKKEQPQIPVFVFKAQPLRTTILHGPVGVPPKKVTKATVPLTPNIKIPERFTIENTSSQTKSSSSEHINQSNPSRTTKIQPFSFDQKIKDILLKKEENIKKVIEEEKKNFNSFRANPLPSFIGRGLSSHNNSLGRTDVQMNKPKFLSSPKKEVENEKSNVALFKARPAFVIHKKPFVPVLAKHEWILPDDFRLNTEKRALERQKFDEKMKQKQEAIAEMLQKLKEEAELNEKMKKLEERKLTEFKAKPVPKYKPFELMPADPSCLTLPQTPRCFYRKECKN